MGRIRILDDAVINQIAAGEVVERPASVVKELVENSIDAGATEITVSISNGGQSLIEVVDNGCGMSREEALLAVERFGTSKISAVEDLMAISTLGFRGEALPSIASVSNFSLVTRLKEGAGGLGTELRIDGGRLRDVVDYAMEEGTRVVVKQLFCNVPARRKFLRSETTESGLVRSQLIDLAAAHPEVRFRILVDGRELFNLAPAGSFVERVKQVRLVNAQAIEVLFERAVEGQTFRVAGVLGRPIDSSASAAKLRLIVNTRSVRDKLLLRAIREGYGQFLKSGRYPVGVLRLEIPASEVDVNVHPQKAEVRFRQPDFIFRLVRFAVSRSLGSVRPGEGAGGGDSMGVFGGGPVSSEFDESSKRIGVQPLFQWRQSHPAVEPGAAGALLVNTASWSGERPAIKLSALRYVGQIFQLYLLLEGSDVFAIVDMHAAHERVTFYRLKRQLSEGEASKQMLLLPEIVEIPMELRDKFLLSLPLLEQMGFEAEQFGDSQVIVRAIPSLLGSCSAGALFNDLFGMSEWEEWEGLVERNVDAVLSRLACHASVRAGREIKPDEVYKLLESLEEAESSAFCPHGRPVAKVLSSIELEALFGRI